MHADKRAGAIWALAGFACFGVMALAFFRFAPWPSASTRAEAELQWPGRIDPSWRAVVNNHGKPMGWPHGTVRENPYGFFGCTAVMLVAGAGWFYCFKRARSQLAGSVAQVSHTDADDRRDPQ